ncbi:MAG: D-alanyl-D-alanine carboxypeptidase [Oscillospiraceae bacterium]|nr:D-alanyl-D-alanine carboxypeptidase [Oscillospiraceae bacterium]
MKIIKNCLPVLLALVLLCGLLVPCVGAADAVELVSPSVIVTELTSDTTLLSSAPARRLNPGSIVKVISLYMLCCACFEGSAELRDKVTITESVLHEDSGFLGLKAEEVLKYEDLLYLMFMDYSETAAYAAAVHAVGSAEALVDRMNAFAGECGCENTVFTNITGAYDEAQHTTGEDLVRMIRVAAQNSLFMQVFSARTYTVGDTNMAISRVLVTSNQLQRSGSQYFCPECTGGRFGGISDGYTTISLSQSEESDMTLIVLVSGALTMDESYADASALIRWTFDGFSWQTIVEAGENITQVSVDLGRDTDHVVAVPAHAVSVMLDNDIHPEDFQREIVIYAADRPIQAPVDKGQLLGEMHLMYRGTEYASVDLVAAKPVELMRMEYLKRLIADTAKSKGVITLLTVLVVLLAAYLVYALTYRAYRIGKKGRNAVIKKRLRERRRLDGGISAVEEPTADEAQIIDIADHMEADDGTGEEDPTILDDLLQEPEKEGKEDPEREE